jgi:hypothetical protein
MSRFRNFVFTLNNYTPLEEEYLSSLDCKYIKYGREVGAQGTPHLQGMIMFQLQLTESAARKRLPRAHVEVLRSLEGSEKYTGKDGDVYERGVPPLLQAGKGEAEQERWRSIRLAAEEGRVEDIPDVVRFKNYKAVEHFKSEGLKKRKLDDTEVRHLWYYGASGTGKSRKAREDHPEAYLKMCNKWWDGYEEEETVLLEDFDKKHDVLCHHLKIWGDRYPFLCEYKGGAKKIRPKLVIVTSNYHPRDIWTDPADLNPILRRFQCVHFPDKTPFVQPVIDELTNQYR